MLSGAFGRRSLKAPISPGSLLIAAGLAGPAPTICQKVVGAQLMRPRAPRTHFQAKQPHKLQWKWQTKQDPLSLEFSSQQSQGVCRAEV